MDSMRWIPLASGVEEDPVEVEVSVFYSENREGIFQTARERGTLIFPAEDARQCVWTPFVQE